MGARNQCKQGDESVGRTMNPTRRALLVTVLCFYFELANGQFFYGESKILLFESLPGISILQTFRVVI